MVLSRDIDSLLALLIILEGISPFLSPRLPRPVLLWALRISDKMARVIGGCSV